MKTPRTLLIGCSAMLVACGASAELLISDSSMEPQTDYQFGHPMLHFLVFSSPETRGQAILPPAPVFVAPPPLIWRASGIMPPYPPASPTGFNQPGSPSNRDIAGYSLARAHAMGQNLYDRRNNAWAPLVSPNPSALAWPTPYAWSWGTTPYPPVAPGQTHPSNRDNASYLLERAHRFSQDAYRKP
jgi:hypothetical protein